MSSYPQVLTIYLCLPTLLHKSCLAKLSAILFIIFLLKSKVWVPQGKSAMTFTATTFLEDPIFHLVALIRHKSFPKEPVASALLRSDTWRALAITALGFVGFIFLSSNPDLHRSHQPMDTGNFQPPSLTSQMASEAESRGHSQHLLFHPHHLQPKTSSWELMSAGICRDFLLLLLPSQEGSLRLQQIATASQSESCSTLPDASPESQRRPNGAHNHS